MQNKTPAGGQRGRVLESSGMEAWFEAGTTSALWKELKADRPGPKGWNDSAMVSRAKTDVPSLWWVVMTMRGAGIGDAIVDSMFYFEVCL